MRVLACTCLKAHNVCMYHAKGIHDDAKGTPRTYAHAGTHTHPYARAHHDDDGPTIHVLGLRQHPQQLGHGLLAVAAHALRERGGMLVAGFLLLAFVII
jgi:hypothetical protein